MTGSRVRVVSDGAWHTTVVLVDGVMLDGVMSVSWTCDVNELARAVITVDGVVVDLDSDDARVQTWSDEDELPQWERDLLEGRTPGGES